MHIIDLQKLSTDTYSCYVNNKYLRYINSTYEWYLNSVGIITPLELCSLGFYFLEAIEWIYVLYTVYEEHISTVFLM